MSMWKTMKYGNFYNSDIRFHLSLVTVRVADYHDYSNIVSSNIILTLYVHQNNV